ncbi:MAG TPA: orotidine-5'-phosphate decarboxylase [Candidatus Paceibacterota bacterium]
MSNRNFRQLLEAQWSQGNFVCVGLDSDFEKIPEAAKRLTEGHGILGASVGGHLLTFNRAIVEATKDLVCAYKFNWAFYGQDMWWSLRETIVYIRKVAPAIPIILDAKYGDTTNSNVKCVEDAFDFLQADAITIHPYLGADALQPFLDQKDKGIFVLCRTSNPGAGEFQNLNVHVTAEEVDYMHNIQAPPYSAGMSGCCTSMSNHLAYRVSKHWNNNGNCALVVGATYPSVLAAVRSIVGDMPILIPGIGAQGGDVEKTVSAGKDIRGQGMIINSSRGIIFASQGEDFAEAARHETLKLHTEISRCRSAQLF